MALIRRIGFSRLSRWGDFIGRLHVSAAKHTDALDGTDELAITCDEELSKGDRIVWVDWSGRAHEHIVDSFERTHDDAGHPETSATCINSIAELWDDWVDDKRPSGAVSTALTSILEGTRWGAGACDQPGSASRTFYHESVREALADLVETWGGELETDISVSGATVTSRLVRIRSACGDQGSHKRFTWTKDLVSVKRTVGSDNPKTRVYAYGKGVETDTGGYGRRLTIEGVNNGLAYVEDTDATEIWGHPDGKGGKLPASTSYIDEECEDAAQLLSEAKDYLDQVKEPKVTYTASVIDLYAFGRSWEGVGVGDCVTIVDKGFSSAGVRLHGRVSQIERDLLTGDATVTFGTLTDSMADMWQATAMSMRSASSRRALYDAVASASPSWLTQLQESLNKQFASVGTYKVETFELGQVFSNVPLDQQTGLPVKSTSGMWAVNINGMGIRLASSLTASGEWDWKTFITGEGAVADLINVGTLNANLIKAGILSDKAGKNSINMETGDVSLSAYATKTEAMTNYFVCSTAGATAAKVASYPSSSGSRGFSLYNGVLVYVYFAHANSASGATLDVAGTGAKTIVYDGYKSATGKMTWLDGTVVPLIYETGLQNSPVNECWRVADASATSSIRQLADSISLSVTGSLGGKATIKLMADGSTDTETVDLSGVRSAFANDHTAVSISAGTVTFNSNTFVVNSTYFKVSSTGVVTATSGTIGGMTLSSSSIYSGKSSLTSNAYGVYVGTDGISTGSGTAYTALAGGYLRGGDSSSIHGYVGFNNYWSPTNVYGTRLAGKGCIALLTNGPFGIGSYYDYGSSATITTGQSGHLTYISSLSASWTNMSLTGTYNVPNLCQNLSINWTTSNLYFTKGLMTTTL